MVDHRLLACVNLVGRGMSRERDEMLAACAEAHRGLLLPALAATEERAAALIKGAAAQLLRCAPVQAIEGLNDVWLL